MIFFQATGKPQKQPYLTIRITLINILYINMIYLFYIPFTTKRAPFALPRTNSYDTPGEEIVLFSRGRHEIFFGHGPFLQEYGLGEPYHHDAHRRRDPHSFSYPFPQRLYLLDLHDHFRGCRSHGLSGRLYCPT